MIRRFRPSGANSKIPAPARTVLGFSHLLDRLDADADRAAAAYEQLRLALEKFFDWHGVWPPEECADETLDRLARKLDAGAPIDDVRRYAHGIARLVLLEWQRRPVAVSMSEGGALENLSAPPAVEDNEPVQECFDRCLAALPAPLRTLVLEYYVDERRTKIDNRRRLARAFGLSDNALRHRVQRVRDRLERCVRACTTVAARRNQEAGPLIRVDRKGAR